MNFSEYLNEYNNKHSSLNEDAIKFSDETPNVELELQNMLNGVANNFIKMHLKLMQWSPNARFWALRVLCTDNSTHYSAELTWKQSGKFSRSIGNVMIAHPIPKKIETIDEIRNYTKDNLDFLNNVEKVGIMVEKKLQDLFNA